MIGNWFECKVRYERMMENGIVKKVTEPYIFDVLSFTEAESRIIEELKPYINGEFTISDIKRTKYSEIITSDNSGADKWYKCRIAMMSIDDKDGKEKTTFSDLLVQANHLIDAINNLEESIKGSLIDYRLYSVSETKIVDVYFITEGK